MNLFDFKDISKTFNHKNHSVDVLKGVSISLEQGETVLITGNSGAGKSSLLWIMAGIDPDFEGTIYREGVKIHQTHSPHPQWSQDISLVFQNHNLIPGWTALENILAAMIHMPMGEKEKKEKALSYLETLGLKDRLDHFPRELSIGQRQRVSLARSIATEPKLLLADEPISGVDKECAQDIVDLLVDTTKRHNMTLVVSSHGLFPMDVVQRRYHLDETGLKIVES